MLQRFVQKSNGRADTSGALSLGSAHNPKNN
jgi:hypothetical protein